MMFLQENPIVGNIYDFFSDMFNFETNPTKNGFILTAFSIICDDRYQSLKRVFEQYYKDFSEKSKNELYNLFGDTQYAFPYEWNKEILKKALALIPEKYSNHAIFLSIDDTIVEKYGTKFENCSDIFDHNKNDFVNGYCLLSVVMTFPVEAYNITRLIKIPLGFKILIPKNKLNDDKEYKTKFDIYSEWLKEIIDIIGKKRKIIILCDAWYTKGQIIELYYKHKNVELICAVNKRTNFYLLPPERVPGQKGRTPLKGRELAIEDLIFESIPDEKLQFAHKEVKTDLFGLDTTIELFCTKSQNDSLRYFICTDKNLSSYVDVNLVKNTNPTSKNLLSFNSEYLPFCIYTIRWNIETFFYEIKKFLGLESFMVRKFVSIYRLINFLSVVYASTTLLPYYCKELTSLQGLSTQEIRTCLGGFLRQVHFLGLIGSKAQQRKMPEKILNHFLEIAKGLDLAC